jgi:CBS domain-containing protein
MRVREVIRKQPIRTIKPNETVAFAKELFRRYDVHHLLVMDGKNLVGIVSDRDLADQREDLPVQKLMISPPITIPPDEHIRKAASLMSGQVIGSLPVVEDGKVLGIITTYDLITLIAKGAIHAAPNTERRVLAKRGPRRKPVSPR